MSASLRSSASLLCKDCTSAHETTMFSEVNLTGLHAHVFSQFFLGCLQNKLGQFKLFYMLLWKISIDLRDDI